MVPAITTPVLIPMPNLAGTMAVYADYILEEPGPNTLPEPTRPSAPEGDRVPGDRHPGAL
jgi:hypothetical protein